LGAEIMTDWQSWTIALLSAIAFFTIKKVNAAYIILGGAVLGYLFSFI
jgi:chromate transporter